jgi:hypothetical protein
LFDIDKNSDFLALKMGTTAGNTGDYTNVGLFTRKITLQ